MPPKNNDIQSVHLKKTDEPNLQHSRGRVIKRKPVPILDDYSYKIAITIIISLQQILSTNLTTGLRYIKTIS